jgi:hypothetical protein
MKPHARFKRHAALLLVLAPIAADAQNLLQNGDFESPGFSAPPFYRYLRNGDTTTLAGWIVIDDGSGEASFVGKTPAYSVASGSYAVFLNQGSGMRTTFPVVSNTVYELSLSAWGSTNAAPLAVWLAGVSHTFPVVEGRLSTYSVTFTAHTTDPQATLEIRNESPPPDFKQWGIDAVSIVEAPLLRAKLFPALLLQGNPGRTYRVDYTDSLVENTGWQFFTNVVLTESPMFLFDVGSTNALRRFYRASELP